ncbi:MAG: response regulator [Gloeomargarita sp. SKYBB_i_bin120]|nr:response regulator [Gloeomargarita sp. SKYG98]MCS7292806.1 response regulator [Gloeomargarita sp. SKYB120]MDW8178369.1 response regulator [Gloeomargarita sp. SKYBB_i_bin120]
MNPVPLDNDLLTNLMAEARQGFLEEEAPQYLETLRQGIAAPQWDYDKLMRAAHTLKGGAGTFQMRAVQTLAHHLEDLLELMGQRSLPEGEPLVRRGVEELAWLLDNVDDPQVSADPELLAAIAALVAQAQPAAPSPEEELRAALTGALEDCLQVAEGRLQQGDLSACQELWENCVFLAEELKLPWLAAAVAPLRDQPEMALAQQVIAQIRQERDQYLGLTPAVPAAPTDLPAEPEVLTAGPTQVRLPLQTVEFLANTGGDLLLYLEKLSGQQEQLEATIRHLKELVAGFEPVRDRMDEVYEQLAMPHRATEGSEFDPLEMDRFSALHETLQACQEFVAQVSESAEDLDLVTRSTARELVSLRRNLNQIYSESTKALLNPFHTLTGPFTQKIQRLAQRYGKQVRCHVEGAEVLLDRVLLERLKGPLTHLVNNAFDHGIETPAERLQQGKPATAQITLKARIQGNQALISIRDDGRGVNLARVYQKARERGLTQAPYEELSREELLNFLFIPGFSTSEQVSELSGRGVGLDAVRTEIRQLGGTVEITSEPGQGTEFTLRLPLAVSLLPLLIVRAQGQLLGFLADSVLDILREVPRGWDWTQPLTLPWRDQEIPVYLPEHLLAYNQSLDPPLAQAILVLAGPQDQPLGLVVDELSEVRQRMVKRIEEVFPLPTYLVGAAVLPSGESIPVLLPSQLRRPGAHPPSLPSLVAESPVTKPTILVAEDSVYTRRIISSVLGQAGYDILACRDGQEAWETLLQNTDKVRLVLTDLEMPRLNGWELVQSIREHPATQGLPVVMLTSRTGDRHRQKAAQLGVNGYLGKPCNPRELLTTIGRWVPLPQ